MPNSRFACAIDGVTDRAELDFHSVGGVTVVLCRRCYGLLLDLARTSPERIWQPPDQLETIGRALIAEADLLAMLAQQRLLFGWILIDRVRHDVPIDTGADVHSQPQE